MVTVAVYCVLITIVIKCNTNCVLVGTDFLNIETGTVG